MRNIKAKKIVIKVGTNTLTNDKGMLDLNFMQELVAQISEIRQSGKRIMLITSGAIGAGMKEIGLRQRPNDVVMKQVCAAVGQNILMSNYHAFFGKHNIKVAQILLTYEDFNNRKTFNNLKNSLDRLLQLGVVPIINENDPISIDEIGPSFGDNDNLSALIASRLEADMIIMLTNVAGLFNKNPNHKDAVLINEVRKIDKKIEAMGGKPEKLGIGGMLSKIKAAKIATKSNVDVVIANGRQENVLIKILNNEEVGTFFPQIK